MDKAPPRTITGGPWWTQIKVILIQEGLLDNQNPSFYMGWPGFYYLLDNIHQLGTVCEGVIKCYILIRLTRPKDKTKYLEFTEKKGRRA